MKNFRNYYKLISVLLLTLWMVGCEQEIEELELPEATTIKHRPGMERVAVKQVPSLQTFMTKQMGAYARKSSQYGEYIETPMGMVPLQDVLTVTNQEGVTNYTFKIIPKNIFDTSVYNLIVHIDAETGAPSAYILEYRKGIDAKGDPLPYVEVLRYPFNLIRQQSRSLVCKDEEDNGDGDTSGACDVMVLNTDTSDGASSGDGSSSGGGGINDGNIPSPADGIVVSPSPVTIVISSDSNSNTDSGPGEQNPTDTDGCYVVDQVYYDDNNNIVVTYVWVAKCPRSADDRSMSSNRSSCGNTTGDVGIDLSGITLEEMQLLRTAFGTDLLTWLQSDCELISSLNGLWMVSDRTEADAMTFAALTQFIQDQGNTANAQMVAIELLVQRSQGNMATIQESLLTAQQVLDVVNEDAEVDSLITVLANKVFAAIMGIKIGTANQDLVEYLTFFRDLDPDGTLGIDDWKYIAANALFLKGLSLAYPASNHEMAKRSATLSLLAPLKQLIGEYMPQTEAEWQAVGQILTPLLIEIGLAAIPGSDIIGVVQGIANNDYLAVALALGGLAADLFGATIVKVIAKFGKAAYKGFKIIRVLHGFLVEVGQIIARGYKVVYENGQAILKKAGQIIAQGDEVVESFVKTSGKLEALGLDDALLNDPDIIRAFQRIDCN